MNLSNVSKKGKLCLKSGVHGLSDGDWQMFF